MTEQSAMHLLGRLRLARWSRLRTWSLVCALPLGGVPAAVFAQSVPPALRACAAETDAGQRLDCYDQTMARLLAPTKQPAGAVTQPDLPASGAPAAGAGPSALSAPAPSDSAAQAQSATSAQAPPAPAATPADAAPADGATSAHHGLSSWKNILSGGGSWEVKARVASLDRSPDTMVLHLDNGQTWHQIARVSGDLTLHTGDSVTIEKHLGSYWLSSQYVSNMQVRLEPAQLTRP